MSTEHDSSSGVSHNVPDRVSVSVPPRAEFVAICRLALAGLGGSTGLDQEEVADLKLAVTEACAHMIGTEEGDHPNLQVDFEVAPDRWTIEVRGGPESKDGKIPPRAFEADDLGLVVMRALVDEVTLEGIDNSSAVLRLVKHFRTT
ncbi:MAG: hypothetical protein GX536_06360 [Actinobacteria bacterium]|nr:hypothetical protein [Actinomycetota bacterium]OPZ75861.1 MAG: Serine-protein kinase RsbW [Actinobacteria bacterium ADurb.Bin444]